MIQVLGSVCKIGAWIDAGKRPEIVNEMGLVEISAIQRDARPIYFALHSQTS